MLNANISVFKLCPATREAEKRTKEQMIKHGDINHTHTHTLLQTDT